MKNLIPTPRTDKNGRTVIRYMKPDETVTKAPTIPAVVTPQATATERIREVIALIQDDGNIEDRMDHPDLEMYLRYVDDDNPKTIPLFKKLLTTGSPQAQQEVASYIHDLLGDIKGAGDGGSSYDEDENGEDDDYNDHWNWTDRCPDAWYPSSAHSALRIWNTFTVMDENGISGNRYDIIYRVSELGTMWNDLDPQLNPEATTSKFWRGAVAAAIGAEASELDREQWSHIKEFVDWAGKHEDIGAVISTVQERGILHKETLEQLIEEKSHTTAAVREGVL